jgi:hypothetical protein
MKDGDRASKVKGSTSEHVKFFSCRPCRSVSEWLNLSFEYLSFNPRYFGSKLCHNI